MGIGEGDRGVAAWGCEGKKAAVADAAAPALLSLLVERGRARWCGVPAEGVWRGREERKCD